MWLLDARTAFYALSSLLLVPAAAMLFYGLYKWVTGTQQADEEARRLGRMLTMFGTILIVIILVVAWFLTGQLPA